jgi:multimeric flavodoxin WrbA
MDRRNFLTKGAAATAVFASLSSSSNAAESKTARIVGVSCSPRKGKTTAMAVKAAIDAAQSVNSGIKAELIDLGDLNVSGYTGDAKPAKDDFDKVVLPKLREPLPDGLIIGSPVYFRTMSALCKAFLERLTVLRKPKLLLADIPIGVLAVGAYRNGGQELVIEQIQSAMLCHEVMIVGGKPGAHQGATLWNAYKDDIEKDGFGIDSAKKLGIRVAEAALRLTQK